MSDVMFVESKGTWQTTAPGVQRRILAYDDVIMMVAVRFESGAIGAVHHHPHRQVTYVAQGQFEITVNEQTVILAEGASFFAPPDAPHGVRALSAGTLVDVFTPAREDFLK